MARIRSIHPDACESHTLATLDAETERTWWRLLPHCDDHGRMRAAPDLVASRCYAVMRHVDSTDVAEHLVALARAGLIRLYHDGHRAYLQVVSWDEYQHPKNPGQPKCPDPDDCDPLDPDELASTPALPQPYPSPTPLEVGGRRGEVGGGEDDADASPPPSSNGHHDPIAESFDDWWQRYPRHHVSGKPGGGGSRKKALQRWRRMTQQQRDQALAAVDHYRAWVESPAGEYAAHATTWLNDARWEQWQEPAARSRDGPPGPEPDRYDATQWG